VTPHPRRFTARDGLPLAALDWGGLEANRLSGRAALLCLPGLCRTGRDFGLIAERHAAKRRVVALDYAGHGESGRAADPARYSPEHAVRDLLDAMAALHLSRVAVIGTSFGGILAMLLGVLRPAALAGVVLNDIGPRIEPAGLADVHALVGCDRAFAELDAAAAWLRQAMPPLSLETDAEWRRFAELTFAPGPDGMLRPRWDRRLIEALSDAAAQPDLSNAFRSLAPLPVLLVWGEVSRILAPRTIAAMRAQKPDLRVLGVPGIGHVPSLSEPAIAPALDRFLDTLH